MCCGVENILIKHERYIVKGYETETVYYHQRASFRHNVRRVKLSNILLGEMVAVLMSYIWWWLEKSEHIHREEHQLPPVYPATVKFWTMASTSFPSNSALLFEGFLRNFSSPLHEFASIVENLHRISWVCFGQSLNGRVPQDTKGQPRLHHLVDCVNRLIITNCNQGWQENAP